MALPMVGNVCFFFVILYEKCYSFCYVEKNFRSECVGLVKHVIILNRVLRLQDVSKICCFLLTSIVSGKTGRMKSLGR